MASAAEVTTIRPNNLADLHRWTTTVLNPHQLSLRNSISQVWSPLIRTCYSNWTVMAVAMEVTRLPHTISKCIRLAAMRMDPRSWSTRRTWNHWKHSYRAVAWIIAKLRHSMSWCRRLLSALKCDTRKNKTNHFIACLMPSVPWNLQRKIKSRRHQRLEYRTPLHNSNKHPRQQITIIMGLIMARSLKVQLSSLRRKK